MPSSPDRPDAPPAARVPDENPAAAAGSPWRLEVGRFRAGCPQRTFPMGVHVGSPAGPRTSFEAPWPVPATYDVGLRFDLLTGLMEPWVAGGAAEGCAWLTRQGVPELHDQDAAWHAAAIRACDAVGLGLVTFRVVTKSGWLDVRTGERRTWKRLRL